MGGYGGPGKAATNSVIAAAAAKCGPAARALVIDDCNIGTTTALLGAGGMAPWQVTVIGKEQKGEGVDEGEAERKGEMLRARGGEKGVVR